ncbi:hypothetical protein ILYODFUR_013472 [Ilyodon furcidens]|uniref:Secreted protein n=1 Tax=Ilyodon furcidens TaxID=33524 RepID=A0ABV0U572_9TELE
MQDQVSVWVAVCTFLLQYYIAGLPSNLTILVCIFPKDDVFYFVTVSHYFLTHDFPVKLLRRSDSCGELSCDPILCRIGCQMGSSVFWPLVGFTISQSDSVTFLQRQAVKPRGETKR